MRRIVRTEGPFDLLRCLDAHARKAKVSLRDDKTHTSVLQGLASQLQAARSSDTLIHGLRVEAMFAHVAASLGRIRLLKQEDAGELYTHENSIQAPDYRVILLDGTEFLVEVKNHRPKDAVGKFVLTSQYLASVQTYAKSCSRELLFAIYWSQAKLWTLVPDHAFERKGDKFFITLPVAMKCNRMELLGDVMVGTLPSITLKLYSDPAKPRGIGVDGTADLTIGRAEIFCGENLLLEPKDTEIAWFLLNYGQWPVEQLEPEIDAGNLISFGLRSSPSEESLDKTPFRTVGFLSQMISRQYNTITSTEGEIDLLAPNIAPDRLGVVIPVDFKSDRLPLWLFRVHPAVT